MKFSICFEAQMVDTSRESEQRCGYFSNEYLAVGCPIIVSDDGDAARRIGFRGQRFFAQAIHHWYGGGARWKTPPQTSIARRSSRRRRPRSPI